ncbi:hypothetical protein JSR02_00765 [Candidatus Vidania fulgoroideae]|uniref:Ribosomal protein L18 n=1 Tax=Candidatus Vidania fulgoroideorum TaxID=881286 RepID=A0A974X752_9PROT|nr:hypothetical protein JSR02_00765 [Candidatus Vidania fulgoroideae]
MKFQYKKKELKNNIPYTLTVKKSNKHIYIYIYKANKIITMCSTNTKTIKNIAEPQKNSFHKIKKLITTIITILKARNIYQLQFNKNNYPFKCKLKLIYESLKAQNFISN